MVDRSLLAHLVVHDEATVSTLGDLESDSHGLALWVLPHWRPDAPSRMEGGRVQVRPSSGFERAGVVEVRGTWRDGEIVDAELNPTNSRAIPYAVIPGASAREVERDRMDRFTTELEAQVGRNLLALGGSRESFDLQVLALDDRLADWLLVQGLALTVHASVWPTVNIP